MDALLTWFDENSRSLPWRGAGATPWRVLVSEFMLQQTPVARVQPRFIEWMNRWPTPADCAAASGADVLRQWSNLGYPRRALWLRDAACRIHREHDGKVPDSLEALLALPGVGDYTARAVLSFGFARRVPVVDTNVRRVLARIDRGIENSPIRPKKDMADLEEILPCDAAVAARASLAIMEFGALVCTARTPHCENCPVATACAWRTAGYPQPSERPRSKQAAYLGSDRQVRGRILALLRASDRPRHVDGAAIDWEKDEQVARAIDSLAADGLIIRTSEEEWTLPE